MNKYQKAFAIIKETLNKIKKETVIYYNGNIIESNEINICDKQLTVIEKLVNKTIPSGLNVYSKCPKCFKYISKDDKYCKNCGQRIIDEEPITQFDDDFIL